VSGDSEVVYIVSVSVHDPDADLPSATDLRRLVARALHEAGFDFDHVGVDKE
jgi:hypothetical protein